MKKAFLLLTLIFVILQTSYAQQIDNYHQDTTTLYQRKKGFYSDPIRSKWKQEVKKEGDVYVLSLYDKKGLLQEKIPFADKNLEERKGAYVRYQDGKVKEEGYYEKGYKNGEWKLYDTNHQLLEKLSYKWDKLYGQSMIYWENGQIKAIKNYVNDVKAGEWKAFYKDGKLALNETYDDLGKLITSTYFDEGRKTVDVAYVMKALF